MAGAKEKTYIDCNGKKIIAIGQIYKIIYPNGKIYIGQDRTDDINYFGSANSHIIAASFTKKQRRLFTVTKEILFEKAHLTIQELNRIERKYIALYNSDDPVIGYNRTKRKE